MKNQIYISFVAVILLGYVSCSKDQEEKNIVTENLTGKWIISGNNNGYESFEFNKSGNYIVVLNQSTKSTESEGVFFGTYITLDDKTIELSDFGKMTISSISSKQISFSIVLQNDPQNELSFVAAKAAEFGNTNHTELLCQTWKVVSINGESVVGTEDEVIVLFSLAGTYLVVSSDGESDMAQWKWKNSEQNILCYSWEGEPTCDGEDEVQIIELTATTAKVLEEFGGETYVYLLVPFNNKSASIGYFQTPLDSPKHGPFIR